jgi:tRNA U34 5-carboxymethylaminomethyl modifying GTPase MnmE/TrmE
LGDETKKNHRKLVIAYKPLISAFIDFAESEDIESDIVDRVRVSVKELQAEFLQQLENAKMGERLREGLLIFLNLDSSKINKIVSS